MKKALLLFAAVFCVAMSSCTKVTTTIIDPTPTTSTEYGYIADSLKVVSGYSTEGTSFLLALTQASYSIQGNYSDSAYIKAIQSVVDEYNYKHIFGNLYLWSDKKSNIIKTFTMTKGTE